MPTLHTYALLHRKLIRATISQTKIRALTSLELSAVIAGLAQVPSVGRVYVSGESDWYYFGRDLTMDQYVWNQMFQSHIEYYYEHQDLGGGSTPQPLSRIDSDIQMLGILDDLPELVINAKLTEQQQDFLLAALARSPGVLKDLAEFTARGGKLVLADLQTTDDIRCNSLKVCR